MVTKALRKSRDDRNPMAAVRPRVRLHLRFLNHAGCLIAGS